jgi:hypothetical protein
VLKKQLKAKDKEKSKQSWSVVGYPMQFGKRRQKKNEKVSMVVAKCESKEVK